MDEARKKLRICLIFLVIAAVVIGVIYYVNDVYGKNDVNDGTLVQLRQEKLQYEDIQDEKMQYKPEECGIWQEAV